MTNEQLQALYDERVKLVHDQRAMTNKAHEHDRALTVEEELTWDKMEARFTELTTTISREEELRKKEEIAKEVSTRQVGLQGVNGIAGAVEPAKQGEEYREALNSYIRYGYNDLDDSQRAALRRGWIPDKDGAEVRAQSVGTTTAGGFSVADDTSLMSAIESARLAFGGVRQVARVITTSTGADLPIPTDNDTAQTGELLGENVAAAQQDVTFGQLVLGSYKYSSKLVKVSIELLQDSSIDIGSFLGEKLGVRLGRITSTHFTTGTGSSQPNGIVTASTAGKTTAGVAAVTRAEIIDLIHSVDPAYRETAGFMFNDTTLSAIKKLVDANSLPIYTPSPITGKVDMIEGFPFTINQQMASMATAAKFMLFGQLDKYLIRDVMGISLIRLDERYAEVGQVAFLAFMRTDGDLLDAGTNPVKHAVNA